MYDLFLHLVELGDLSVFESLIFIPLGVWVIGFFFPGESIRKE